jgi:hypothetical protein
VNGCRLSNGFFARRFGEYRHLTDEHDEVAVFSRRGRHRLLGLSRRPALAYVVMSATQHWLKRRQRLSSVILQSPNQLRSRKSTRDQPLKALFTPDLGIKNA